MKEYTVECTDSGNKTPVIRSSGSQGVFRVNKGDLVVFHSSSTRKMILVDIVGNPVEWTAMSVSDSLPVTVSYTWTPDRPGPFTLRFEPVGDLNSFSSVDSTIVVNSRDLSCLRMLTVMPRRLGPISNWPSVLHDLVISMNYNAVHFTPCQPSGPSHSSYSIADVLDVEPILFIQRIDSREQRWKELQKALPNDLLKITDIVLNHASSSHSWVCDLPGATYCLSECPYLTGAADLDSQLHAFANAHPEYLEMRSEEELRKCMHAIRVVLEKFAFSEYFQLDMQSSSHLWGQPASAVPINTIPGIWQGLQQAGTGRTHKIIVDLRHECQDISSVWRELNRINEALLHAARDCFESATSACESTIRYERLVCGKIDGPLVPIYFSQLSNGDKAANNGWVMNWPAGLDFAAPGHHLVFMRRHVVAWGDCLKLRYHPESPAWGVMEQYCEKIASTFDGIRLDNCHSTPIHVLRRLVHVMRKVNPDLVIVAELFTGEAGNDDIYEASIGIDLLVKEAMQINSVEELMGKVWRCSNVGIADVSDPDSKCLVKRKASAIIYDATHDNSTCHTKFGSFREALPLAAAVAAAPAAMGSSVGFDSLRTLMPSVVTTDARTRHEDIDAIKQVSESRIYLPGFPEARSVTVYGDWNNWEEAVELERHSDGWYLTRNIDLEIGRTEYKFFVDKVGWVTNPSVGITSGPFKNNLYGAAGRFCDIKRTLLEFQGACNLNYPEFYSKMYPESNVLEIKRFNSNCEGYVFLIRFGGPVLSGTSTGTNPVELEVESSIQSVELAVSVVCPEDEQLESFIESHFEGQIVHWTTRDLEFTSLASTPTSANRYSIKVPMFGVVIFKMKARTDLERLGDLVPPPVTEIQHARDFSFLLFSCESEEPVYDVPEMGKLVYAGFSGFVNYYDQVFNGDSGKFLSSPLAANIRNGDWLFDFTVGRLESRFPIMFNWVRDGVRPWYVSLPSGLKPRWFVHIIKHLLYNTILKEFRRSYGGSSLALASFQFTVGESVAAGLPHFASGYMRCWGRDTFIAFPGLFLASKRFDEGRECIMSFARVVRHGLIPNLYDEGNNPRYNARDASWFFLNAIRHFIETTKNSTILEDEVMLRYPDRAFSSNWKQPESNPVRLVDIVVGILMSHLHGIDFVEENAGPRIDEHMTEEGFHVTVSVNESGLVVGGNEWNCGTWMDKMGSVPCRNKGVPATSRHGANIEINGIALAVLEFFGDNTVVVGEYGKGSVVVSLKDWRSRLSHSFDTSFWNHNNRIYNDTICGDAKGKKLRPNGLVALSQIPIHAVNKMHASQYIQACEESLLGPLGMRTLSATDPDYNGWYDNSDSSGGYNYHNGPEWVWLVGHFLIASWRFEVLTREQISTIVARHVEYLETQSVGWKSLPELTNMNGAFCMHSCPSQAWSVCCVIEALETIRSDDLN